MSAFVRFLHPEPKMGLGRVLGEFLVTSVDIRTFSDFRDGRRSELFAERGGDSEVSEFNMGSDAVGSDGEESMAAPRRRS